MCAIVGFWDRTSQAGVREYRSVALGMASVLSHRGPDDQGAWADETMPLALGHRRLAILDLSAEGHQPMMSADGRFVMVFNGEIYNFQSLRDELEDKGNNFRGHSDTEVMLAAFCQWGVRPSLERFNGMFAFALWDRQKRLLHLVRDRAGEKPLYYGWSDRTFMFGSELKALRAHPRWQGRINRRALALLMRYGYVAAPCSIYENIYKLPAASILTLSVSCIQAQQTPEPICYWAPPIETADSHSANGNGKVSFGPNSAEGACAELHDLLFQAVGQQMVADVPLGAFLSGGIDSSVVVALMQAQSTRAVKTFSIGFDEENFNEAPFARAVAEHLGTDQTELYVREVDLQQVIPQLPDIYDEPFADSSQIPTALLCRLTRSCVTVSLSGDGGDELFGGYNHYRIGDKLCRLWQRIPVAARIPLAMGLRQTACAGLKLPLPAAANRTLNRMWNFSDILPANSEQSLYQLLMSPNRVPESWLKVDDRPRGAHGISQLWDKYPELLQRMMWQDFAEYLPDDILVKVDRAAMAVSLETRIPLLDRRVIEFAFRLPTIFKQREGYGKWLLRQVLYKYVPPALVDRPKKGFSVPLAKWLSGPLRDWAEQHLNETRLRREGFFNVQQVRQNWQSHLAKKRDWSPGLWHALMFQAWLERQGKIQARPQTDSICVSSVESGIGNESAERISVPVESVSRTN